MCLRVTTMDDVDINVFRFDWDQTLHMFFMNAQSYIYCRYGVRKDGDGQLMNTIAGIKDTMRKVLDIHKREASKMPPAWKPIETQDLISFKKDPKRPNGCLHCHHAGFYVRKDEFTSGRLTKDQIWGFPLPDNIGITLDVDQNTLVKDVKDPAQKAGVRAGDRLVSVDGQRVVTPADIVWILNVFKGGSLRLTVDRAGKTESVSMTLKGDDWRKTDIAWRDSWWDNGPNIALEGEDLNSDERKKVGLSDTAIAIRVKKLMPNGSAARGGILENDIVVSVDNKTTDLEAVELLMWMRLVHRIGDTVPFAVLRGGQKIGLNVKLR